MATPTVLVFVGGSLVCGRAFGRKNGPEETAVADDTKEERDEEEEEEEEEEGEKEEEEEEVGALALSKKSARCLSLLANA